MEQKQEKLFVTVTLYLTMLLLILSPIYRDGNHMILTYSQQITRQLIVTANHQTMEVTVNVESSQVPIHKHLQITCLLISMGQASRFVGG